MRLNLLGTLFFGSLGLWLAGHATKVKLRGTPQEIEAVTNALLSSKRFQDELEKPGATVEKVFAALNLKNMSADQFERQFHVKWPL